MIDDYTKKEIRDAVKDAFAASAGDGRYVDITRVPLLCQAVIGIDKKLDEMVTKQEFWPVKTIVYGAISILLVAVVMMILASTFHLGASVQL